MKIMSLPTPALIADEGVMNQNMDTANEVMKGSRARLRPHFKSHKCAAIAHRQMEMGAVGITCAKLSEAEDLIFSGIEDVLIANQIVELDKIARLAILAKMCRLTVCVDDIDNAKEISRAAVNAGSKLNCLVEYDIGMNRCGVRSEDEYVRLAAEIEKLPGIEYEGIQAYAGHVSHMLTKAERKEATEANSEKLRSLINRLGDAGIRVNTVSGGSTGTIDIKAEEGLYTEIQAGSYFFMDNTYNKLDIPYKNSLYVLATVVSKKGNLTILDVGVKGLGTDQDEPAVVRLDGTEVSGTFSVNEEHMKIFDSSVNLEIGEKVKVIPGHCCSTVNLYDDLYLFRGDKVVDRLRITARGKSQ